MDDSFSGMAWQRAESIRERAPYSVEVTYNVETAEHLAIYNLLDMQSLSCKIGRAEGPIFSPPVSELSRDPASQMSP
jgi:hypothetical protein